MTKVITVRSARKDQGECGKCGVPIRKGDAYIWWKFRFGGVVKRCVRLDCYPKRSELTQSEILSTLWSLVDDFEAYGDTPAEVAGALRDFADSIRSDVIEGLFEDKLSNIESGMGHTNAPVYEELESRKSEMESWCDEMDSVADDIENLEQEADPHTEPGAPDKVGKGGGYRVIFKGQLQSPNFNDVGPASIFLQQLRLNSRSPEPAEQMEQDSLHRRPEDGAYEENYLFGWKPAEATVATGTEAEAAEEAEEQLQELLEQAKEMAQEAVNNCPE